MQIITVGGMIGVGKTTYIDKAIARDKEMGLKSKTIYELFEPDRLENSIFKEKTTRDEVMDLFLKLYYENVDKLTHNDELERVQGYTVTLGHQVNFLANRASKVLDAIEIAKQQGIDILYLDRTIFEDLIFTKRNLFDNQVYWFGYMTVWEKWFNLVNLAVKEHNLRNIVLVADETTILKRIAKRGREMEQGEELTDYFKDLNKDYAKELKEFMQMHGWSSEIINNED